MKALVDWLQLASDCKSTRLGPLLTVSFLFAALGFWFGPVRWVVYAPPGYAPNIGNLTLCIWLGWTWLAVVAVALSLHGRRALWLLAGAPFVLLWPAAWIAQVPECSLTGCV